MNYREESLKLHGEWKGKIEIVPRVSVQDREHLSLAYTPGVAEPCLAIHENVEKSFDLTRRWNTVPVITDGTAVLGLGDIGPEAGMPVMEGKCALFKEFAGVDAFPICVRSKDVDEIVRTIYLISGSFGGINLEDIKAPECFYIEERLRSLVDIPVLHDDQHGTAVTVAAALINACEITDRKITEIKVVICGAGSAGISTARMLLTLGVSKENLIMTDSKGVLTNRRTGLDKYKMMFATEKDINSLGLIRKSPFFLLMLLLLKPSVLAVRKAMILIIPRISTLKATIWMF